MPLTFGTTTRNYVSTLMSPDIMSRRDILSQMLDITNEKSSFVEIMELLGRSKPTANPEYYHMVNEELHVQVTVSGTPTDTSSGTDGTRWDVTVSAADYAKVREGELVLCANKKVGYIREKKAANVLDILSVDDASLALADTQIMAVFGNAAGEGSSAPTARRYGASKEKNHIQIFKEAYEITDIELGSKVEFTYNGQPSYVLKGQAEAFNKFQAAIASTFILGRMSTDNFNAASPNLTDKNDKAVATTKGLNQYCEEGISLGVTGVSLATYATIARQLAKARAPYNYMVLLGTEQAIDHHNMFVNLSGNAFSSQARINVGGASLDLGLSSVTLYNRTFYFKPLPILDHKILVNFTNSSGFQNRSFFLPMDNIETIDAGSQPRFMTRYLESAPSPYSVDLRYREFHDGALAPIPIGTESVFRIVYESRQGLHCLGKEHFLVLDK